MAFEALQQENYVSLVTFRKNGSGVATPMWFVMRDGKVVYMLERSGIENRDAVSIASELTAAFDKFCTAPTTA